MHLRRQVALLSKLAPGVLDELGGVGGRAAAGEGPGREPGCFNVNLWMHRQTEAWAWARPEEELVDRRASPWDDEPRRASHADKRKALQGWCCGTDFTN